RPRFDERFREAWDAYVTVNRAFADRVAETASNGDIVLVQDYHLALVPGDLRNRRPDLRVVHFTHTPFCGPTSIRVLPAAVGRPPAWRERVVFVAMLNESRQGLPEYQAYRQEVEQAAARVNERWARRGWDPVVMDLRDDFPRSVAGYARYDALLVNPLMDGLN